MGKLILDITMSLDGYVAGPNPSLDDPLGEGGEQLHEWVFGTKAWRGPHGMEGGEDNADSRIVEELTANRGATIMGRRMYSGGQGAWEDDPNADGWWGDDPPFHHPVFVLTHHPRERREMQGGTTFTFVTEGIESALEQAQASAGEKDVAIGGGADVAQQYLRAGLLDELHIHVAPMLLGAGTRLFEDDTAGRLPKVEITRVVHSPAVAHLSYRVAR